MMEVPDQNASYHTCYNLAARPCAALCSFSTSGPHQGFSNHSFCNFSWGYLQSSCLAFSTLFTCLSTRSTRPSTPAINSPYPSTLLSYHCRTRASLRCRSSAISPFCALCVASIPFIRGTKVDREALRAASGIGVSFIDVSDEAVEGYSVLEARTI
jgi:hypothetical protein